MHTIRLLSHGLIDADRFMDYDERARMWKITDTVRFIFPAEYEVNTCIGRHWRSSGTDNSLTVSVGYEWDGASGPTFDSPPTRVASLIHDLICDSGATGGYVIRSYFARHSLYRKLLKEQGAPAWRANMHFVALILFNKVHELKERLT